MIERSTGLSSDTPPMAIARQATPPDKPEGLSNQVVIDMTTLHGIGYDLVHNGRSFITSLSVRASGPRPEGSVRVTVKLHEGGTTIAGPWVRDYPSVASAGVSVEPEMTLDPAFMRGVEDQRPVDLTVTVSAGDHLLGQQSRRLQLYAHNQWILDPEAPAASMGLLASHVQPNDPLISAVLSHARERLKQTTRSSSTEGYQSGPVRVQQIAASVYDAVVALDFAYSDPPASWSVQPGLVGGQKVRTHAQVVSERAATCLDSAVLYAAALEAAGLHPQIWLPPGHALVGYFLEENDALPSAAATGPQLTSMALNLVDQGLIGLIETTVMPSKAPFATASRHGLAAVNGSAQPIMAVVDVAAARRRGFMPLPAARANPDGAVEVYEYQAGKITMSKAIKKAAESTRVSDVPLKVRMWKNTLLDLGLNNNLINFKSNRCVEVLLPPSDADLHPLDFIEDQLNEGASFRSLDVEGVDQLAGYRGAGSVLTASDQRTLAQILVAERRVVLRADGDYKNTLRRLRYESRSSVQESGSNNLYLTLGALVWHLDGRELRSPLILVPILLEQGGKDIGYSISLDGAGASTPNYCLLEKLKAEFGLDLPALENPLEDQYGIAVADIFATIRKAITERELPFRIDETAYLATLQFAKFRLWKDLDEHWRLFSRNRLAKHLIESRTEPFDDQPTFPPSTMTLDELASLCPVPGDASQLTAVASAVRGETFVLEGPPGTGKSQTITNLLARSLAEGRKVLFVAEKRAALDVVQARLEAVGLGPFSLDLHDKGSKPALVRGQLLDSMNHVPRRDPAGVEAALGQVRSSATILSRYRDRLHQENSIGYSLYSAHERILALTSDETALTAAPVTVDEISVLQRDEWDRLRHRLLDLGQAIDVADQTLDGPWTLSGAIDFEQLDRRALASTMSEMLQALDVARSSATGREALALTTRSEDLGLVRRFVDAQPPEISTLDRIADPEWFRYARWQLDQLRSVVDGSVLRGVSPDAWSAPLTDLHQQSQQADQSGFLGRKKRQLAMVDRVQPLLGVSNAPLDRASVTSRLSELIDARERAHGHVSALSAMPGLAATQRLNPLLQRDLSTLESELTRLQWLARTATQESPVRELLRAFAADPSRPTAAVDAAVAFSRSWAELRRRLSSDDHTTARWLRGRPLLEAIDRSRAAWSADAAEGRFRALAAWLPAASALQELHGAGLRSVEGAILNRSVDPLELEQSVVLGVLHACVQERESIGRLDAFQQEAHSRTIDRFARGSANLRARMTEEIPADLIRTRPFDGRSRFGKVGGLMRELNKERRFLPIRRLLKEYGDVIKELTPCFLVSPDSAARFLEPGAIEFDLVVFDEASQIRVAESIGAIGRGKAVVIVGDSRQMPPTAFGGFAAGDDLDDLSAEEAESVDEESILTECVQARVSRQWLTWHYRSRDEALIAFSNSKYYDGKLSSFPAPQANKTTTSVSHVHVTDGHFYRSGDRKTLRTNPREAAAVAAEVVARLRADPGASVGVVTFNKQQTDLIRSLLLDSGEPAVVASMESDSDNGLFVKNLENVQGDERDVIIFSMSFSKNEKGVLPLTFGPLNRAGGERRLNVAVTRARQEVRVFSSFLTGDMRIDSTESRGLRHLHDYLALAINGTDEIAQQLGRAHNPDDRHRDEVARCLRDRGWVVRSDVGLSDFRIDLVVERRDGHTGDLAAVLLDGPGWATRPTVSDRDGLPVDVLRGMMRWPSVCRLWLPTWLNDKVAALDLLENDLLEAERLQHESADDRPPPPVAETEAEATAATADSMSSGLSDFELAVLQDHPVDPPSTSTDMPARGIETSSTEQEFQAWEPPFLGRDVLEDLDFTSGRVTAALASGIDAEGPIHVDRLVKLLAASNGIRRLTADRQAALTKLVPRDRQRTEGSKIIWPAVVDPSTYRTYRPTSTIERETKHVPAIEIGNAMVVIVERSMGIDRQELLRLAARLFGVDRLGVHVRAVVEAGLGSAVQRGLLSERDGQVVPIRSDGR